MFGTIYLKSRPIRLAYLIDPNDINSVREAIRIGTSLWGGCYNPIVPIFDNTVSSSWRRGSRKALKGEDLLQRFIDVFDPDYLIQCTNLLPEYAGKAGVHVLNSTEIWKFFIEDNFRHRSNYGVSVFELLNSVFEKHFKSVDRNAPKIILPQIPKTRSLFWASIFGEYPDYVANFIDRHYKELLAIESPTIEPHSFPPTAQI